MANGPTQLTPFFGGGAQRAPFRIPTNVLGLPGLDDPRSAGALQGFSQGFLRGDQTFADALTRGIAGGFGGFAAGEQFRQQQAQEQAAAQAAAQQQEIENRRAQAEAQRKAAADAERVRQFGVTEGRLLTKDQREAQDLAFKQNNALQKLQLDRAKLAIDQANSVPDKLRVLQAMGLDPSSGEGRQLLSDSLTKSAITINQPKLSPGQIPIDPNDLSKGTVAAKDIGQARVIADNIRSQLGRYREALTQFGAETLPGPAKDRLRGTRTQLLLELKTLNELGALTGPDLDLMDDLLIDPTSVPSRVGNAFSALAGNSLGERALQSIDLVEQTVNDRLNAITGQVGAPAVPQAAPVAPQAVSPADLGSLSIEQLQALEAQLGSNP